MTETLFRLSVWCPVLLLGCGTVTSEAPPQGRPTEEVLGIRARDDCYRLTVAGRAHDFLLRSLQYPEGMQDRLSIRVVSPVFGDVAPPIELKLAPSVHFQVDADADVTDFQLELYAISARHHLVTGVIRHACPP